MKIRSMQTCIMSSLPHCIFRCSVFRYVTLVSFFFVQTLLFNCNSFTLVANKYLLTYLVSLRIWQPDTRGSAFREIATPSVRAARRFSINSISACRKTMGLNF